MKYYLTRLLIVFTFLLSQADYSQNVILPEDLNVISGEWKGTLTYLDYSTNKAFKMPANVTVEEGKNEYQVLILINYTEEPNANSKEKIKISKDGLQVNKTAVKSRQILASKEVQITTEYLGKDNNKNALIRNVYILGPERFITRKEVKFDESGDWLMRNEYNFVR